MLPHAEYSELELFNPGFLEEDIEAYATYCGSQLCFARPTGVLGRISEGVVHVCSPNRISVQRAFYDCLAVQKRQPVSRGVLTRRRRNRKPRHVGIGLQKRAELGVLQDHAGDGARPAALRVGGAVLDHMPDSRFGRHADASGLAPET